MEDALAERIKRYHGDFVDPDGEYEIVSSLLTSHHNIQYQEQQEIHSLEEGSDQFHHYQSDEHSESAIVYHNDKDVLVFYYIKILWIMATVAVFVWLWLRWIELSPTEFMKMIARKTRGYYYCVTSKTTTPESTKIRISNTTSTSNTTTGSSSKKNGGNSKTELDCSARTAKAFRHGQNLSLQFEKVKQQEEQILLGDASKQQQRRNKEESQEQTLIQQSYQHIGTTTTVITREVTSACRDKLRTFDKGKGVAPNSTCSSDDSEKQQHSISENHSCLNARSPSPPTLVDDNNINEDDDDSVYDSPIPFHLLCNMAPTPDFSKESDQFFSNITYSSIMTSKKQQQQHQQHEQTSPSCPHPSSSPSTPLRFDNSLNVGIQQQQSPSLMLERDDDNNDNADNDTIAPHSLAQEFCRNVKIIEQVLLKSGTKVDSSKAVELALIHQSSQLRMKQQEQQFTLQTKRQHSSLQLNKYDEYLKELSDVRIKCIDSIGRSINHSFIICVVLEGARHAARLLEALEYFSFRQAGYLLLQMACGCDEENVFYMSEDDSNSKWSYFSFILPNSINTMFRNLEPSLIKSTDYASCALSFVMGFTVWKVTHTVLREIHCPSLLHQMVNGIVLTMYLAHNPGSWIVVIHNLEKYKLWLIVQILLTTLSLMVALTWYMKTRACLLEFQKGEQPQHINSKDNQILFCEAKRRILHLEDLSWIFAFGPPMVMGLVILMT